MIEFEVIGAPEPKGSMVAILVAGRPQVIPDNKRSKAWERAVRLVASRAMIGLEPLDEPVGIAIVFTMPKPAKPLFAVPATKPDWDKLSRSTCDALSKIVYVDDSRIVSATVRLEYGATPGASIRVSTLATAQLEIP